MRTYKLLTSIILWRTPLPAGLLSSLHADQNQDKRKYRCFQHERTKRVAYRMRSGVDAEEVADDKRDEDEQRQPALPLHWHPAPAVEFAFEPIALRVVFVISDNLLNPVHSY